MLSKISRKRFWIITAVGLMFVLVLLVQFITLAVLRGQNSSFEARLNSINEEIASIPGEVGTDAKIDEARWEYGYQYPGERTLEEGN